MRRPLVAAVVAALLVAPVVVHRFTPRLFAWVFRTLLVVNRMELVRLGPYRDEVGDVVELDPLTVSVPGEPDATVLLWAPREPSPTPRPLVLMIHGGGWMVGTPRHLAPYGRLLASRGFVVASLGYALAPEHRYPTPVRQLAAAVDHLQAVAAEHGADPTNFFLLGNSAGAQLASQLGALVTNPAYRAEAGIDVATPASHLRGLVLFAGPYDLRTAGDAGFPGFRTYVWAYTGRKDYESFPRIDELSATRHATSSYPPTYLTSGDADPLESQTQELDAVLRAHGVDVTTRYWTGSDSDLPHDYVFDLRSPEARVAFDDVITFLHDKSAPCEPSTSEEPR